MFTLQNAPRKARELSGLNVSPYEIPNFTAKFDLTLTLVERRGTNGEPDGVEGLLEYSRDRFEAETAVKLTERFARLLAAAIETLAEMLTLAEKNGVSKKVVAEMISKFSPLHSVYANQIAEQRFEPAGFRLTLGLKDINLIMSAAASSTTPLPLGSLLHDRWVSAIAKGRGDLDWSAIALNVSEDAGLEIERSKNESVRSARPSAD